MSVTTLGGIATAGHLMAGTYCVSPSTSTTSGSYVPTPMPPKDSGLAMLRKLLAQLRGVADSVKALDDLTNAGRPVDPDQAMLYDRLDRMEQMLKAAAKKPAKKKRKAKR